MLMIHVHLHLLAVHAIPIFHGVWELPGLKPLPVDRLSAGVLDTWSAFLAVQVHHTLLIGTRSKESFTLLSQKSFFVWSWTFWGGT